MTLRLTNIKLNLDAGEGDLVKAAARRLRLPVQQITGWEIVRQALDARHKDLHFVYTLDVDLSIDETPVLRRLKDARVCPAPPEPAWPLPADGAGGETMGGGAYGSEPMAARPVVVGAGPAGLFAALALAQHGYRPLVLERGADIHTRVRQVEGFWAGGPLNTETNVQFGEGGAGTFSDGKLTTRIHDPRGRQVLKALVAVGAPPEVAYLAKAHIGTDRLRRVVYNLRRRIIALGGEVRFNSRVSNILREGDRAVGVRLASGEELAAGVVVLAIGHSARDTYAVLAGEGVAMRPKPFSIGVRVEHPQGVIDRAQYGRYAGHPRLGPADYQLVYKNEDTGRNAYTFCMCPGGQVVAAASETGHLVTNGMSNYARDTGVANSALVVGVEPEDFPGDGPLAGVEFQRRWERKAFHLGGGDYRAPAQAVGDFLAGRATTEEGGLVLGTYRPGLTPADLYDCLPGYVSQTIAEALNYFDRKIPGFAGPDAVLTGVETRTSAPVRLVRGEDCQAEGWEGLYPAGEGAGYAGGIVSAAVDGLRVAEAIMKRYARRDGRWA